VFEKVARDCRDIALSPTPMIDKWLIDPDKPYRYSQDPDREH
jgi:hypothetical protein